MPSEYTNDYLWILEQLRELYDDHDLPYPRVILTDCQRALVNACGEVFRDAETLLCIWHIDKNVEKHCRQFSDTSEAWDDFYQGWHRVMYTTTQEEFTYEWDALQEVYSYDYPFAVTYLVAKLMTPFKRKFVTYWTNQHLHFGNRATSRGECNNGRLKR